MKIYGAGLAGLLAGCIFQTAEIFEAGPREQAQHKAVLRFRSSAVGDALGIPFRKVMVHKGIWSQERFRQPTILLANQYSQKVIGRLGDRSIWNLDPVERFIAPEDLLAQMADRCGARVFWNSPLTTSSITAFSLQHYSAVSTLPMSIMAKFLDIPVPFEFASAPITVRRWRVPNADVFQTIYFPSPSMPMYRASITGDLLAVEYVGEPWTNGAVFQAFGIDEADCEPLDSSKQRFGKIAPIDDEWRKRFIFDLTTKYNIFSLGRFATWRNILLDDVLHDVDVLKRLMGASAYDRARVAAK